MNKKVEPEKSSTNFVMPSIIDFADYIFYNIFTDSKDSNNISFDQFIKNFAKFFSPYIPKYIDSARESITNFNIDINERNFAARLFSQMEFQSMLTYDKWIHFVHEMTDNFVISLDHIPYYVIISSYEASQTILRT